MKRNLLLVVFVGLISTSFAQKHISTSSEIRFLSTSPVEDIEAINKDSKSVIDLGTGNLVFLIPIIKFRFENSLMEEHFNENYMETEKYPKSTFKGMIEDFELFEGEKVVKATGELTIHGQTNMVSVEGKMNISEGKITVDAQFPIALVDYKIKIPKVVFYNIAEVVETTVHFEYSTQTK